MKLSVLISKLQELQSKLGGDTKFLVYNAAHECYVYWEISEGIDDGGYDKPLKTKRGEKFVQLIVD